MLKAHKPWKIEKLYIVKKSDSKRHIGEGLKPYEYFIIKNIVFGRFKHLFNS